MGDDERERSERGEPPEERPANAAPDAVKDPNEKTEGKPGLGPQGTGTGEADPGGS